MAAQKGRDLLLRADTPAVPGTFETIGGMRSKSLTINEETVDTSDSDSANQWRELLEGGGIKSMSVSGSGVFKDSAAEQQVLTWKMAGTHPDMEIVVPDLGTFAGSFAIPTLEYSGEYNGEVQFSMSFESAGEITFTAA